MTTNEELTKKLGNLKGFLGVFPCNVLPKIKVLPVSLIINTKPIPDAGEHWVALYINENSFGTYFDSYGLFPIVDEIKNFIEINCENGWTYSTTTIQGLTSITCGEYCTVFVFLKTYGISLFNIIRLFTTNHVLNDAIVKSFYKKL